MMLIVPVQLLAKFIEFQMSYNNWNVDTHRKLVFELHSGESEWWRSCVESELRHRQSHTWLVGIFAAVVFRHYRVNTVHDYRHPVRPVVSMRHVLETFVEWNHPLVDGKYICNASV
ncbi:hypothetical protein AVEN_231367-1 [Araneus ventricosus]|uniref:Uncharacterized protein n=1 Tax=Araneus ventricosus TaxID=182803 RepID=A0A4Y2LQA8_ARAVE|nr:hypothetical protein AVEN_231367-1 [Araneus ventricosus]